MSIQTRVTFAQVITFALVMIFLLGAFFSANLSDLLDEHWANMFERRMPSDLSDLWPWVRAFHFYSFLTQWQAAGIKTSAMGGFCLCFEMFQLHILLLLLLEWRYGCQHVWNSIVWCHFVLKTFMQHVVFSCFDLRQSIPAEEFASQSAGCNHLRIHLIAFF